MKKKIYAALIAVLLVSNYVHAQNIFPSSGKVGIGTTTPNASSLLEVASTTKGILIPRMTQAQRNAITSPATGLMIYQTDSNPGFFYYTGANWVGLVAKNKVWLQTGNTSLDSTTDFIGTGDKGPLVIRTNNVERMHVSSTGNIGIGTTAPQALLDVSGDAHINGLTVGRGSGTSNAGNSAFGYRTLYSNTTGSSNTAIGVAALYANTSGSYNLATGFDAIYDNTTGGNNVANGFESLFENTTGSYNTAMGNYALNYNTTGSYNTAIGYGANVPNGSNLSNATAIGAYATVAQSNSLVLGGTGNSAVKVGIGTTSPGTTLDVTGGSWDLSSNEGDFRIGNPTYRLKIGVATDGGGAGDVRIRSAGGTNRLLLGSNNADVLTINGAGMVGIGTTNPQYLLSVNGTIRAKEVRVETGWSDFVFDKNYKLRTLDEVEKYISQNHHLPEIPSAAEIQKNGLAIADVQTKMMQKIEELTLYIIQLQKQIDQLKTNNNENK